jgi:hypothetical protein
VFEVPIGSGKKNKYDPLHVWKDHEACFKMQYRGALGKTGFRLI